MKNRSNLSLVVLMMAALVACAAPQSLAPFSPQKIDAAGYAQKVDNLLVVLDASSSMEQPHNGFRKYDLATGVVERLNQTLPDLDFEGGLRAFGRGLCGSTGKTLSVVELSDYIPSAYGDGVARVQCPGGTSPLNLALDAAGTDLTNTDMPTAIIIVSDGCFGIRW